MQKGSAYLFTAIVFVIGFNSIAGLIQKNAESGPSRLRFDDVQSQPTEVIREPKVAQPEKLPQKASIEQMNIHSFSEQSRDSLSIAGLPPFDVVAPVDSLPSAERENDEQLVNEVVKEMQETQAGWRAIRDRAYDDMKLDTRSYEKLLKARTHMESVFDRFAGSKGTIPQEAVDSIEIAQKKYDQYVQNILGQERYSYLNWLRDSYNSEIQHRTKHVTRVADDW